MALSLLFACTPEENNGNDSGKTQDGGNNSSPSVTIGAEHISAISAVLAGKANLGSTVAADLQVGFQYSKSAGILPQNSVSVDAVDVNANYNYSTPITGLDPDTKYYFRSFVRQNGQDTYGETKEFTTKDVASFIETEDASGVDAVKATLNAKLDLTDIQYKSLAYGFLWGISESALNTDFKCTEIKDNSIAATLTYLSHKTQYWYKAYVKLDSQTFYGEVKTFKNNTLSDKKIVFDVGLYSSTKSGKFDESQTFTTNAWFTNGDGDKMRFFRENETVSWNTPVANQWAPSRDYFWPKTGWVNFFSYAGTPAAAVTEGKAEYSNKTIATDDNALLASAAYRYAKNEDVYHLTYGTENTDVQSVPTLFHHILSKISVKVKFDASKVNGGDAAKYKWDLVIDEAALIYANKGSLTVNFTDPGTTGQAWPYTGATIGWTPKSGEANVSEATTVIGNASKITTVAPNVSDAKTLLDEITVMPQDVTAATGTNAKFAVKFTLTEYYNNVEGIHYTVDLTGADAIPVDAFNNAVSAWNMNYKYVYTLTVKPNKTVTFDPAVAEWEDVIGTATIQL